VTRPRLLRMLIAAALACGTHETLAQPQQFQPECRGPDCPHPASPHTGPDQAPLGLIGGAVGILGGIVVLGDFFSPPPPPASSPPLGPSFPSTGPSFPSTGPSFPSSPSISSGSPQSPAVNTGPPGRLNVGQGRYFFIPPPGETRFVNNHVLVYSIAPSDDVLQIAGLLGLTLIMSQDIGLIGTTVYQFQIDNGASVATVVRQLAAYPIVDGATPDYFYVLSQGATGQAGAQAGDPGQYVLEKLRLGDVHRILRGDNVTIGVIDSEIDAAHPDLNGTVTSTYDAAGVDEKPHPHGTGMAGAIGSHFRLMGIAPNVHILAIHAFSTKAASVESTTFAILKGLDYAAANGVRIINMSFAGPRDPTLEKTIRAAYDKGIIMIAAAGNAGPKSPPLYPAADPNVIAVTATDENDKLFPGANRGKYIAVAAPGVDILVPAPDSTYQLTTGTSVATAHVSGIIALMLERNPKLTPADVRRILTASAKRLGPNDQFGAGLIDPEKALQLAAPRSTELSPPTRRSPRTYESDPRLGTGTREASAK
jgi:subtilisin family serine protease